MIHHVGAACSMPPAGVGPINSRQANLFLTVPEFSGEV